MGSSKWAIVTLVLLLTLVAVRPAGAWLAEKEEFVAGTNPPIVQGDEFVLQRPSMTLFHTQDLATSDNEAFALTFPRQSDGVSFAGPSLAQTSDQTYAAADTGFLTANWCYCNINNAGGYFITPDVASWHPMRSPEPVGSGIIWPYMTPVENTPAGVTTMKYKPIINESPDTNDLNTGNSTGLNTTSFNMTSGGMLPTNITEATKNNTTPYNAGQQTAKPNRDYKNMTSAQIKNESGLEKMWRNANLKNTLPTDYKGITAFPTWIDPYSDPLTPMLPADKQKVTREALQMTRPGQRAYTLMWDL